MFFKTNYQSRHQHGFNTCSIINLPQAFYVKRDRLSQRFVKAELHSSIMTRSQQNKGFEKMDVQNDLLTFISVFLPLIGVFIGWGLFVHGSFIPSQRTIMASIVIFGTSLLLFVSMGNFVETRSFVLKKSLRHKRNIYEQIKRMEDLDNFRR